MGLRGGRVKPLMSLLDVPRRAVASTNLCLTRSYSGMNRFLSYSFLFLLVGLYGSCKKAFSTEAASSKLSNAITAQRHFSLDSIPVGDLSMRGMTFAHEGYDGIRGYGGTTVSPSLDSLAKLNVNAIAIVPYTFMRDPNKPTKLPIPTRKGMETDAAVLHSVKEAKKRGWSVLMKPQIWIGNGHWPGDVEFDNEADWNTWFENYAEWIIHYATLCEANDVDALCLGTELVHTTLTHPEKWRHIIAETRKVYSGTLTYAANWGEEFEGFSFWDDLDVVGLNSYYPLSPKPNPSDAELLAGAKEWMIKANNISAKAGKPLWLTEVGFRSAKGAWINPHESPGDRMVSDSCQARCYHALVLASQEAPMLEGMFVWKWPSYLGRGQRKSDHHDGRPGRGYVPGGKAAGEVLKRFYEGT